MLSIQPKWCEKIADDSKSIEIRKTKPRIGTPFRCYIYETKGVYYSELSGVEMNGLGKVIGEFVCIHIESIECDLEQYAEYSRYSCVEINEFIEYSNGKELYAWYISDLKIYDKPKKLNEFGMSRPPQSWCYVEREVKNEV